jgi:hypothetical protein
VSLDWLEILSHHKQLAALQLRVEDEEGEDHTEPAPFRLIPLLHEFPLLSTLNLSIEGRESLQLIADDGSTSLSIPSLTSLALDLKGSSFFDINNCHQLNKLVISWSADADTDAEAVQLKLPSIMEACMTRLTTLTELEMAHQSQRLQYLPLSTNIIRTISPRLQILKLFHFVPDMKIFASILQHCDALTHLTFSLPESIPSWIISLCLIRLKLLKELHLNQYEYRYLIYDSKESTQLDQMRLTDLPLAFSSTSSLEPCSTADSKSNGNTSNHHDNVNLDDQKGQSKLIQPHHHQHGMVHHHLLVFECDIKPIDDLFPKLWSFPRLIEWKTYEQPSRTKGKEEEGEDDHNNSGSNDNNSSNHDPINVPLPLLSLLKHSPMIDEVSIHTSSIVHSLPLSLTEIAITMSRPITRLIITDPYNDATRDATIQLIVMCHQTLQSLDINECRSGLLIRLFGLPPVAPTPVLESTSSVTVVSLPPSSSPGATVVSSSSSSSSSSSASSTSLLSIHNEYPLTVLRRLSFPKSFLGVLLMRDEQSILHCLVHICTILSCNASLRSIKLEQGRIHARLLRHEFDPPLPDGFRITHFKPLVCLD